LLLFDQAAAQAKVQQKFGADWKLIIDWPAFSNLVTDDRYRKYLGGYVVEFYAETIGEEVAKMDDDLAEAIVDLCKDKKLIITITEKTSNDYPAGRYGVEFGDSLKVTVAKDRVGSAYPYSDSYTITALGLKHF
jgi:hypothetical protein